MTVRISSGMRGVVTAIGSTCILAMLLGTLSITGAASARPASQPAGHSLCMAGETRIFSCPLGAKQVSVCGAGKQAVYRYGRPGKIELVSRSMTLAEQGYSGGGETQIQVTNNGYSYILFDRTVRTGFGPDGRHDPAFSSGLLVRRGGRILSSKRCGNDASIPSLARQFMPTGNEIVVH